MHSQTQIKLTAMCLQLIKTTDNKEVEHSYHDDNVPVLIKTHRKQDTYNTKKTQHLQLLQSNIKSIEMYNCLD
jgi:hypothetical protein